MDVVAPHLAGLGQRHVDVAALCDRLGLLGLEHDAAAVGADRDLGNLDPAHASTARYQATKRSRPSRKEVFGS